MVTLIKYGALSGGVKYNVNQMWICGLSTDSKPTTTIDGMPIPNGSVYTEVDTGMNFMFDNDNTTWYEVSIGGGGGGTSGGIVLVGETTTALTDEATTNPIIVDGQSYTAQPNDAVIYGSKEFLFDGTKWHEFGDLSGLASKDIGAMTGYAKASSVAAIATTDTLNQAVGKLEKALDSKQDTIGNRLASLGFVYADCTTYTDSGRIYRNSNLINDYKYVDGSIIVARFHPNGITSVPTNAQIEINYLGERKIYFKNERIQDDVITDQDYCLLQLQKDFGFYLIAKTSTIEDVISLLSRMTTVENNISLLQGKVKAHSEGGTNYDVINGIRVYVSATQPTGDIPTGSLWIGG